MIEVCSGDGLEVVVEGYVAPDRTPEAGSVDRNYRLAVLEFVNGQKGFVLKLGVLGLEIIDELDVRAADRELADLLAFNVHHECLFDGLGILVENLLVGCGNVLGLDSCGVKHLADGLGLDVGVLHGFEGAGGEGENRCDQNDYNGRIYDSINVSVGIHSLFRLSDLSFFSPCRGCA